MVDSDKLINLLNDMGFIAAEKVQKATQKVSIGMTTPIMPIFVGTTTPAQLEAVLISELVISLQKEILEKIRFIEPTTILTKRVVKINQILNDTNETYQDVFCNLFKNHIKKHTYALCTTQHGLEKIGLNHKRIDFYQMSDPNHLQYFGSLGNSDVFASMWVKKAKNNTAAFFDGILAKIQVAKIQFAKYKTGSKVILNYDIIYNPCIKTINVEL